MTPDRARGLLVIDKPRGIVSNHWVMLTIYTVLLFHIPTSKDALLTGMAPSGLALTDLSGN